MHKVNDIQLGLKQGLYKPYLFKILKEEIELKDIKEKLNEYIQEDSIGAGYRNLVRDYVDADLIAVNNKKYVLTQKGLEHYEQLSQGLIKHAQNFNDVPAAELNISDTVLEKFDFKDYPLDIKKLHSLNPELNQKLKVNFELSSRTFKEEMLKALVFNTKYKIDNLSTQIKTQYQNQLSTLLSPKALNSLSGQSERFYKWALASIWLLRTMSILACAKLLGGVFSLQLVKLTILVFLTHKLINPLFNSIPSFHRLLTGMMSLLSPVMIFGIYYLTTKTNMGLKHIHIKSLDIVLVTMMTYFLSKLVLAQKHYPLPTYLKKILKHTHKYQIPLYTLSLGFLGLFLLVSYDIFTHQLGLIISVFSIIPIFIGIDLYEYFEKLQAAALDIKNKN